MKSPRQSLPLALLLFIHRQVPVHDHDLAAVALQLGEDDALVQATGALLAHGGAGDGAESVFELRQGQLDAGDKASSALASTRALSNGLQYQVGTLVEAANGALDGILQYSDEPIVSRDIIHNSHSCIYDAPWSMAAGSMVKVVGWYDNEWGYANRTVDLVERLVEESA